MEKRIQILVICWLLFSASACTNINPDVPSSTSTSPTPDQDVGRLLDLSQQAYQLARKLTPEPVLRQMDTDLNMYSVRFTDKEATEEIDIFIPDLETPPEQWKVDVIAKTPLVGNTIPPLNLERLIVGPSRVASAVLAHWKGCTIRAMTLYNDNGRLTWAAFCNTQQGVVNATIDGETDVFTPYDAAPVPVPVTATSSP